MELDFLIIGAEKAGTTFIHNAIKENNKIEIPDKEIKYFEDPEFNILPNNFLDKLFKKTRNNKLRGIRRPTYLGLPECPERIYKHSPSAKLIISLRNPIERAISAYFHYVRLNLLPMEPLNIGLWRILKGEYEETEYNKIAKCIIDFGLYYRAISRYLKFFPRNQILIIFLKEIKKHPNEIKRQIFNFLDVDHQFNQKNSFQKLLQKKMANKGVYSLKRLKIYRNYAKIVANYKLEKIDWAYRSKLYRKKGLFYRIFFYLFHVLDKTIFLWLFKNEKPKLNKRISDILKNIYNEDIKKLETLINMPLKNWD